MAQTTARRITASKIGDIYRRKKDHGTLADRQKSTRHVTTAAMRRGLAFEPVAADAYAKVKDYKLNIYSCGVIVSFGVHGWLLVLTEKCTILICSQSTVS